jgi:hypothetical protein
MTTTMMASRLATEDTDVRITNYNGAEITTYRNIKQAMHDRRKNELPSGDDGVWYGTSAIIGATDLLSVRKAH